jgi:hypothetical protein
MKSLIPSPVLSRFHKESFAKEGYLFLEAFIDQATISRLLEVIEEFRERSRAVTASDNLFDLVPGHCAEQPMIKCIKLPDEKHPYFWEFATGPLADIASGLIGPNVIFNHSKLNFKWSAQKDQWGWHQDIQYFPHTNYDVVTIGTYLKDTFATDGALKVSAGSHCGPLFDLYDNNGKWSGYLSEHDANNIRPETVRTLEGKAGSVIVINCRLLHMSSASERPGRPLLANIYSAADAFPYQVYKVKSVNFGKVVRGEISKWARHDPRPCLVPPRSYYDDRSSLKHPGSPGDRISSVTGEY